METISLDDFLKLNLAVATIVSAEPIENADKLLKLTLNVGEESPRQLVAGIAKSYAPQDLVGQQIIIIKNLEPKTIKGVTSQGMLLAADTADGPVILTPQKPVPVGTNIR